MAKTPYPPYVVRLLPNKVGNGMDSGQTTVTGNTVWHSMYGTLDGSDAYFRLPSVAAATNWGIGGSRDGVKDGIIYQWVKPGGMLIPWASGPWKYPGFDEGLDYVNTFQVYGINARADSIEFSGLPEDPLTVLQWQNGMWLTAAILHAGDRQSDDHKFNMHHREFCTPSYKDCPWPRIYDHTEDYNIGINLIMQHYEGKTVRDFVEIAGLVIPLPLGKSSTKPVPMPKKPLFIAFDNIRVATVRVGATFRQYGDSAAKIYLIAPKEKEVNFVGYYHGQNVHGSDKWYVTATDLHERVHSSGILSWQDGKDL